MDISASYAMDGTRTAAAAAKVRKYERFRSTTGIVACALGFTVVNLLDPGTAVKTAGNIVLAVTLLTLLVFTVGWLRTAGRVRQTAAKSTRPTTVSITDDGLSVTRAGAVVTKAAWKDVAHCTSADSVWIFALKRGADAVLIPQNELVPADRAQAETFLRAWGGKRRYRVSPW